MEAKTRRVGVKRLQPVFATTPDGVNSRDLCPVTAVSQLTSSRVPGVECDSFNPRPHAFFFFPLSDSTFQEHPSLAVAAEGIPRTVMTAGAAVIRVVVVVRFIISIQRCTNWVSHYVTLGRHGYYVTLADAVPLE